MISHGVKAFNCADNFIASGAIEAGHAGMGTIANVVGKEAGYAAGGIGGAAKGAAAGASLGVSAATVVGGIAGSYICSSAVAAVGGGRGAQNHAGEVGDVGGSASAGAVVGACIAGPAGAAAGAAVGVAGYGISKGITAVVGCFISDDRYEWGLGWCLCFKCRSNCQNRGCKDCHKNVCLECWPEHVAWHKRR